MNPSKMGQRATKPTNPFTETYKSQHHMEDDYEKAKRDANDTGLALAGNPHALSQAQTRNAFHAEQRRKEKEAKERAEKEANE